MTDPYIDGITGKVVVSAVTPIHEKATLLGATAIDLSIDTIIEQVKTLKLNIPSFAFLTKILHNQTNGKATN